MRRLASKAFWSLVDQALFATANFAQNLTLARWLSPREYGLFAVVYAVLLLAGVLHGALLTEPMMVYGAGRFRDRLPSYLPALLQGQALFSAVAGGAGAAAGLLLWLAGERDLVQGLFALAVAQAPILFLWLVRRACYVRMEAFPAAVGSLLYAALMMLGLLLCARLGLLSAVAALGSMALASLITGLWLRRGLLRSWGRGKGSDLLAEVRHLHWHYGAWALVTGVATWVPENATHLLFPAIGQIELSGALRAVSNLVVPIGHVNTALGQILLPTFVRQRQGAEFRRIVLLALLLLGGLSLGYAAVLAVVGRPLMQLLYAGKYTAYAHLLWLAALLPLGSAVKGVFSQALRALEQPQAVFWAYLPSILVTFTVGFGLTLAWGVIGSLLGKLIASAVTSLLLVLLFYRSPRPLAQTGRT